MVDISMEEVEIGWRWDEEEAERDYYRPEKSLLFTF